MFADNKKYNFSFNGTKIIISKKDHDTEFHPYAKALVYALYHTQYRTIRVEPQVDDRYTPDLCALDDGGTVILWAEVGNFSLDKIEKLIKKYRRAHFVFVKEERDLLIFNKHLDKLAKEVHTLPLIEIIVYPEHFKDWNVSEEGDVFIRKEDVNIIRWHVPKGHVDHF